MLHTSLGSSVPRNGNPSLERKQRRGENDFPAAPSNHVFTDFPGQDKLGIQIDLHHRIPIFIAMLGGGFSLDGAGIIDQNIDPGEICFYRFNEGVERCPVGKIAGVFPEFPSRTTNRIGAGVHRAGL